MAKDQTTTSTPAPPIPIIDFTKWYNATTREDKLAIANELIQGCQRIGFAYIVNHGIPETIVQNALETSRRFFRLPYEEKMQAAHPPGTAVHRGWTEVGRSKETIDYDLDKEVEAIKRARGDFKETYDIGGDTNPVQANIWPPDSVLPRFEETMVDFYWQCNRVSQEILRAIAMGLGLQDDEKLTKVHSGNFNQLRLAHYPPINVSSVEKNEADRLGAHADFSTVTLLFQDDAGGLQVRNPYNKQDETFVDATPIKGACVMNIGDPLMRWSNDVLLSNIHRVGLPPLGDKQGVTSDRYSLPYFVAADPSAVIEVFPECTSADRLAKYEKITTAEYHKLRFAEYFDKKENGDMDE